MKRLITICTALLIAGVALADPIEKTVAAPGRDEDVKIGVTAEGVKVESVRIQNYPDTEQVAKAKNEDPNDKSFIFWNFSVSNPSSKPVKLKIDVTLIGKDGKSLGRSDRSDTVDAGKTDDNLRVMMHPKILDLVDAKNIKVVITASPK